MTNFRTSLGWIIALSIVCIGGCDGSSPVGVTGEVSLDGAPLPAGTIVFEPVPGSDGQRRDATIENGHFVLPDEHGMLPGQTFQVVIKAFRKTGRMYPNADRTASADEMEQYLPANYNAASTLRVTVSPNAKVNHHKFELNSTGSK
jgi:hypothetical protein